ncbi:MAG: hypothetical protein E7407_01640 [Ruminococcaceae bacterium]|nr:hypothetical protein [Oscillospiraceae bacterium]
MREYIIAYGGNWIHFFIKPHVGLCSRQKNGFRFEKHKIVLAGAVADFCVYSSGNSIHIVCQDQKGSVLYLLYDGDSWQKNVLLQSRTAKPYNKNFVMTEISGYINLLYLVENKERVMLVHQILHQGSSPQIVAYIKNDSVPFCVCTCPETDFSVYYKNENGISCRQIYKWSQKKFLEPTILDEGLSIRFSTELPDGKGIIGIQETDNVKTLVYIENDNQKSSVCQDLRDDIIPIISRYLQKQYIVWTEYGNIMSSCLQPDGKWSKPMQYAKSSSTEAKLYAICKDGIYDYYYGVSRENDITLYGTHDILKKPPEHKGHEIISKKISSPQDTENLLLNQERQIKLLCDELSEQRQRLADLSDRIEALLESVSIADEESIDNVLLN